MKVPFRRRDAMLVPLAVEEVLLGPGASARAEIRALRGERGVGVEPLRQALDGLERGEVEKLHLRIGAVVVDIHRVVLAAFHHAVPVGVPAAIGPAELERLPDARVERAHPRVVACLRPAFVGLDDALHLPVGCRAGEAGAVARERLPNPERDCALVGHRVPELDVPHILGDGRPEVDERMLVAPDVGAAAVAAAGRIADALPAEKVSVGGAEAGGRAQGGEVEERGLLHHDGRARRIDDGPDERDGGRLQLAEAREQVFGGGARGWILRAVEVADMVVRGVEPAVGPLPRGAVGEAPGNRERNRHGLPGGDVHRRRERTEVAFLAAWHVAHVPLLHQPPPELLESVAPAGVAHVDAGRDFARRRRHDDGEFAGLAAERPVAAVFVGVAAEDDPAQRGGFEPLLRERAAAGIGHRGGDSRADTRAGSVDEAPPQQRHRHPARIGVALHQGVHGLKRRLHRNCGVGELDLGKRIGGPEDAASEARIAVVGRGAPERAFVAGLVERALKQPRHHRPGAVHGAQDECGADGLPAGHEAALGGVADLERAESASAGKAYCAGADSPKRHHDAAKAVAPVLADGRPGRLGPGGGQGHGDGGRRCQHHAQDDDSAPHGRAYLTGKSKYVSG